MLGLIARALAGRYAPRVGASAVNSKRGNKGYYKGKGAKSTGHHTRRGGFVLQPWKLPRFVVPDLSGFDLKAYVSVTAPKPGTKAFGKAPDVPVAAAK